MSDAMSRYTSEKQEQAWRSRELLGLRHILSAILLQLGGEFVLDDRCRLLASPDDSLEFMVDTWNRVLRIRRMSGQWVAKPVIRCVQERLPDWML